MLMLFFNCVKEIVMSDVGSWKKRTKRTVRPIQMRMAPDLLARQYRDKPFMDCMVELLKNTRDAGASCIDIITTGRDRLVIVDNGFGMTEERRDRFLSMGEEATDVNKSAQYDTGVKFMIFAFSESFCVRTVTSDDPDGLVSFSSMTDKYNDLVVKGSELTPRIVRKTSRNWKYDQSIYPHGTEIEFMYANPGSRAIQRGDRLARSLSARLPIKLLSLVRVDGERLPGKEVVGEVYDEFVPHLALGDVSFELYRPKKRSPIEDLRLGDVEIGEGTFKSLLKVLPPKVVDEIPDVYSLPEVCGTITSRFLRRHCSEGRATVSATIADDPRLANFIEVLQLAGPAIARHLNLRIGKSSDDDQVSETVNALLDHLRKKYPKGDSRAVGAKEGLKKAGSGGAIFKKGPFSIRLNQPEFEVNEEIVATLTVKGDYAARFIAEDVSWDYTRSLSDVVSVNPTMCQMRAKTVGTGKLSMDQCNSPHAHSREYLIVHKRVLRFDASSRVYVKQGLDVTLRLLNTDKVQGDIVWELDDNYARQDGDRVFFQARDVGVFKIVARDSKVANQRAVCTIQVEAEDVEQELFPIRDEWFRMEYLNMEGGVPIKMARGGSAHVMYINTKASGFLEAKKSGNVRMFLLLSIAHEFPFFMMNVVDGGELRMTRPYSEVHPEIRSAAYEVFAEMM